MCCDVPGQQPKRNWATLDIATRNLGKRSFRYRQQTSDEPVIQQIFIQRDYDISRLSRAGDIRSVYQQILSAGRVPLIIDAGANIGAGTLYLADTWPEAQVIAIEPGSDNLELLSRNTSGLQHVSCIHAALACRSGEMLLIDPGIGHWGLQALPASQIIAGAVVCERISAIGMHDLLQQQPADRTPFLCKIDIEGGERDLFSDQTDWIDQFALLVIELHDLLMPRQGVSRSFLQAIAMRDRDFVYLGENIFSIANQLSDMTASRCQAQ
jgi:FkbM family methyltransferase